MIGFRTLVSGLALMAFSAPAIAQTATGPATAATSEAAESSTRMLGGVAAVVNDEVISISDVASRARLLLITLGVQPSQEALRQVLPRAMEELIDERLQLQKAAEYELEIDEREIDAAVNDLARQNQTSLEGLYTTLVQNGVNPQTLREQMRAEIAWRRIINGLYGSRIRISQLQIDSTLDRMENDASEERYQLAEIFLYAPTESDRQQMMQGANVILQQIRQGARFELAAQQYSNSPTAAVGGDLGWVSPTELEPEVQEVIRATEAPAMTPPIVASDGIYIYAVRAKQDGTNGRVEVDLTQVLSATGDITALEAFRAEGHSCDTLETVVNETEGLLYAPLGRVSMDALMEQISETVRDTEVGTSAAPIETPAGPTLLYVCDRGFADIEIPDRDAIEDRLFNQQLSLMAQRELRDLKRDATIIRR
ncbi:peptidylprolyl isomerase [Ponticaulis sp.]|uniref:peptidylprolyl isomerase n=1 Tax=Ponticaulis sp. TaxID=2020902 RepID=UPI0026237BBF|nr:peptidylprolyl isomerase [Ponticaulis sp.]MDF1681271.1 peptidylprolyl isomerase [Ponticaulis sp.]